MKHLASDVKDIYINRLYSEVSDQPFLFVFALKSFTVAWKEASFARSKIIQTVDRKKVSDKPEPDRVKIFPKDLPAGAPPPAGAAHLDTC